MEKGGANFKRYDKYYNRILAMIADDITVATGNSKMEERRAAWTTYKNIDGWFDALKEFIINKEFARLSTR